MTRLRGVSILVVLVLLLVSGCASAPSHYYTLSPVLSPGVDTVTSGLSVVVGPVTVPATVDRPQIVVRKSNHEVAIDELNQWASSLQDQIGRAVARNLEERLGTPYATLSSENPAKPPDYRVKIEVQRFESALGDAATLDGVWTVRRVRDNATRTGRTAVTEVTQGGSYDALAAAHSRAVGRLSQDIAEAIAREVKE